MQNFKLKVWQKAQEMVLIVYQETKSLPKEELYGFISQIRRSCVSIAANLAEVCGKHTKSNTVNYFHIALGSLHETEYYILLIKDLSYINSEKHSILDEKFREIKAMLTALIKSIRASH